MSIMHDNKVIQVLQHQIHMLQDTVVRRAEHFYPSLSRNLNYNQVCEFLFDAFYPHAFAVPTK